MNVWCNNIDVGVSIVGQLVFREKQEDALKELKCLTKVLGVELCAEHFYFITKGIRYYGNKWKTKVEVTVSVFFSTQFLHQSCVLAIVIFAQGKLGLKQLAEGCTKPCAPGNNSSPPRNIGQSNRV